MKFELADRYLELLHLRQIVQQAERSTRIISLPGIILGEMTGTHLKSRPRVSDDLCANGLDLCKLET